MKILYVIILIALSFGMTSVPSGAEDVPVSGSVQINADGPDAGEGEAVQNTDEGIDEAADESLAFYDEEEELDVIADPFEPLNRISFAFNDKLFLWVVKPVAKGYAAVVPEQARICVRNFFQNIGTPARVVNNVLQLKMKSAGNEIVRFGVNSVLGVLGLFDLAKDQMDMPMQDEDLGQTFGKWGSGPLFYINWPVLGPSSLRDTAGDAGDFFLDPISYVTPSIDRYAIRTGDNINKVSLSLEDYEKIKKDAIDPYAAFKDIYYQYRKSKIEK